MIAIKNLVQYQDIIKNTIGLVIVKFGAMWCGPCKMMEPILKKLSEEHPDITFLSVDVDDNTEISTHYNIKSLPTMLFIREGIVKYTQEGVTQKLKEIIDSV